MPKSNLELWGLVITVVEFDVNYFVYVKTNSLLNILMIIIASFIFILALVLSNIYVKIRDIEDRQEEIRQKLIRDKELEDIRLDLREVKRKVFKR